MVRFPHWRVGIRTLFLIIVIALSGSVFFRKQAGHLVVVQKRKGDVSDLGSSHQIRIFFLQYGAPLISPRGHVQYLRRRESKLVFDLTRSVQNDELAKDA